MQKLKLTYFDFDGGRGEAVRLALTLGNVPFEDDRVAGERWAQLKAQQPYCALPVLYVDGAPLAQSNAICRFVGKLTDLYPSDPWQAALCDEVLETVEELTQHLGATMALAEDEKKQRRETLAKDVLPVFLTGLERRLQAAGGVYFCNERLTMADLRASDAIQWLGSGIIDYLPADLLSKTAPALVKHCERVKNEPRIMSYYAKRAKPSAT